MMKDYLSFDQQAYSVVTHWPAAAGFNAVRDGVDYAGLLQWRLLSAVSRSLRIEHQLFDNSAELSILQFLQKEGYRQLWIDEPEPSNLYDEAQARCNLREAHKGRKVIFAPIMIHQQLLLEQLEMRDDLLIIHNLPDPNFPSPSCIPSENKAWCQALFNATIRGLELQSIHLLEADRELLKQDIIRSDQLVRLARLQIEMIEPDLLLIPTEDGWYPRYFMEVARNRNIPLFLIQHGLDCEPFVFDHSRCDFAALWGPERQQRYITPPKNVRITGNPQYDSFRADQITWNTKGNYLLLALRPNYADKLHFPSRSPAVQVQLMETLCRILQQNPAEKLVIKMHPSSVASPLLSVIARYGLHSRCRICAKEETLTELLPGAKAVLTEDSTAGLDAMMAGKPLIFSHFMPCTPTLPMTKYGAALDGSDENTLTTSLEAVMNADFDAPAMQAGQQRFINDFAGELDGLAGQRVMAFIDEAING